MSWETTYPDTPLEPAIVERVVDGDTLIVRTDEGARERVRLVGVNTPESVAPEQERNCEEGHQSSIYTKRLVEENSMVWLQRCVTDRDEHGRLLRYVWLQEPTDPGNTGEVRTKMLNAALVISGYGQARTYEPDTALDEFFRALGRKAADEGRGVSYLWA